MDTNEYVGALDVDEIRAPMIGRKVKSAWHRLDIGEVIAWEPHSASVCDVLVRHTDGSECWYGSSDLHPVDASRPLPSRQEARAAEKAQTTAQLERLLTNHIRDFNQPWPGAEFGKVFIGNAIVGAITDKKRSRVEHWRVREHR